MNPTYLRVIWTDDPNSFADAAYINIESLRQDNASIIIEQSAIQGFDVTAYNNRGSDILAHFQSVAPAMEFCEKLLAVLGAEIVDIESIKTEAAKCQTPETQHI